MSDRERERIEPTPAGQARLLAAVAVGTPACAIDPGILGEYAAVQVARGQVAAATAFPAVASHLRAGCDTCAADLPDLLALLAASDTAPPPRPLGPADTAISAGGLGDALLAKDNISLVTDRPGERPARSHAPEPSIIRPAPGAGAAAPRPPHALSRRDWLLLVVAAAVVVVGVVLLALAYRASAPAEAPAVTTTPRPAPTGAPGAQPQAPASVKPAPSTGPAAPAAGNRAAPTGMDCPSTHPVKGNRESKIYHVPGGQFYASTRPEECFATPADAEAAGYRRSSR